MFAGNEADDCSVILCKPRDLIILLSDISKCTCRKCSGSDLSESLFFVDHIKGEMGDHIHDQLTVSIFESKLALQKERNYNEHV